MKTKAPYSVPAEEMPPPQVPESERALMALLLLHPLLILKVMAKAGLQDEHFYTPAYRIILRHIRQMKEDERLKPAYEPDHAILTSSLTAAGELEAIGGAPGLADILATPCQLYSARSYCEQIQDAARKRAIQQGLKEIIRRATDRNCNTEALLAHWDSQRHNVPSTDGRKNSRNRQSQYHSAATSKLVSILKGEELPASTTGLGSLDALLNKLQPGRYTVLGARPAQGKSALALKIAYAATMDESLPGNVLFYSLEMNPVDLFLRTAAIVSGVPARKGLSPSEIRTIRETMEKLKDKAPVFIEAGGMSAGAIIADIQESMQAGPCKLVIVDYLQIVVSDDPNPNTPEVDRIARNCNALCRFAQKANIHMLMLAQINRAGARTSKPGMSDLKGSGQIEQDADAIVLLHRPEAELPPEEAEAVRGEAWLHVAKNRHGSTGSIKLRWTPETLTFSEEPAPPAELRQAVFPDD